MIPIFPVNYPNVDHNEDVEVIFQSLVDGSTWKRTGHCSRCGDCCDDSENIFAEVDGDGNPGGLVPVVPGKCAYFRWLEDGLAGCVGRDTAYYKNGCNIAPSKVEHISQWDNCTYSFEKVS